MASGQPGTRLLSGEKRKETGSKSKHIGERSEPTGGFFFPFPAFRPGTEESQASFQSFGALCTLSYKDFETIFAFLLIFLVMTS